MNATLTARHRYRTVRHACAASNPHQCCMCGINPHSIRHAREGKTVRKKYQNISHVTRDPAHAAHGALAPIKAAQVTRTDTRDTAQARSRARAPVFSIVSPEKIEVVVLMGCLGIEVAHA